MVNRIRININTRQRILEPLLVNSCTYCLLHSAACFKNHSQVECKLQSCQRNDDTLRAGQWRDDLAAQCGGLLRNLWYRISEAEVMVAECGMIVYEQFGILCLNPDTLI